MQDRSEKEEIAQIVEDMISLGDQRWSDDEAWDDIADGLNAVLLRLRGPS